MMRSLAIMMLIAGAGPALAEVKCETPCNDFGIRIDPQGVLMVGGVDATGTVRPIQTDGSGHVICSSEAPTARPDPYLTEARVATIDGIVTRTRVALGAPWTPQVDAHGFIICSKEPPRP